jgi:hypothetical protein
MAESAPSSRFKGVLSEILGIQDMPGKEPRRLAQSYPES